MTRLEAIRERIEHAKGARPDSLVVADMVHLLALVDDLAGASREVSEFAWSAVKADCEESRAGLMRRLTNLRAALARTEA